MTISFIHIFAHGLVLLNSEKNSSIIAHKNKITKLTPMPGKTHVLLGSLGLQLIHAHIFREEHDLGYQENGINVFQF